MISCRLALVGMQRVWTLILRSPRLLVYSRAAWKLTSRLSFRSSSIETWGKNIINVNSPAVIEANDIDKYR